jgi:hypothetical protein
VGRVPCARIAIIGQAPGRCAQESGIPWDDASGVLLRSWLGVHDDEFYNPALFVIVPMDFYFPGKGKTGDPPAQGLRPAVASADPRRDAGHHSPSAHWRARAAVLPRGPG